MTNLSDYNTYYRAGHGPQISHDYTITNPGAETGDMTGWTASIGVGMEATQTGLTPHFGSYHFGGGNYVEVESYQDITAVAGDITSTLIDSGNVILRLIYWGGSYISQDQARMYLKFYDGSPGSLITDTLNTQPGYGCHGYSTWIYHDIFYRMLPGTRTIRMYMGAYRRNGTYNNGHIDDIELKAHVLF